MGAVLFDAMVSWCYGESVFFCEGADNESFNDFTE